ncbi:hypothetical protein V8C37DRAFT_140388 [Trichoderma ceciliae]
MAKRKSSEDPILPWKRSKLHHSPYVFDSQTAHQVDKAPSPALSAYTSAKAPPLQREKRKRTDSFSRDVRAKRVRTESPNSSITSPGSPKPWPEPEPNPAEGEEEEEELEDYLRDFERSALDIICDQDSTCGIPSDYGDDSEAEDRYTHQRRHQRRQNPLLSPELSDADEVLATVDTVVTPAAPRSPSPTSQDTSPSPCYTVPPRRKKRLQRQPEPRRKHKDTNGQRQSRDRKSKLSPRVVEDILRSKRSSRQDPAPRLWCLGNDGVACLVASVR